MVTTEAVNEVVRRAAAAVLAAYRARSTWVRAKADGSPVTGVDLEADAILRDGLKALDRAVPYLSEEHEIPAWEVRRRWSRYWLVDPLDGTKEFIRRTGEFTVNVALIEDGEPVLGVVAAPAAGLLYHARAGEGAWKREEGGPPRRLRSTLSRPTDPIRIVESRSHPSPALEAFLAPMNVVGRTRCGAALKFCLVAEGKADVYPRLGPTMEWDTAAGDCIHRHSGRPEPHPGALRYNKPSLRNGAFVVGLQPGTYTLPARAVRPMTTAVNPACTARSTRRHEAAAARSRDSVRSYAKRGKGPPDAPMKPWTPSPTP